MRASKRKAEKLRCWRALLLRRRGEELGHVQAENTKAAERLRRPSSSVDEQQRSRLVVNEMAEGD
jgi:hypothetical protein